MDNTTQLQPAKLYYSPGGHYDEKTDKTYFSAFLKELTRDEFYKIVNSERTAMLVEKYREELAEKGDQAEGKQSKNLLDILCLQGTHDEEAYAKYAKECEASGKKKKGERNAETMQPNTNISLDHDGVKDPIIMWKHIQETAQKKGLSDWIRLCHITPSGHGLRTVLARTPEMMGISIKEAQQLWCELLELPESDVACTDISRGSFAPRAQDILFMDERLFIPHLLPKTECKTMVANACTTESRKTESTSDFPTHDAEGNDLKELARTLIAGSCRNGEYPMMGERHSLLVKHAPQIARKCENNTEWLAEVLPSYGLPDEEFRNIVNWACERPLSPYTSKDMKEALRSLTSKNVAQPQPPQIPDMLPQSLQVILKGTPKKCIPAVAQSVFTSLMMYLNDSVRFHYTNNRDYPPCSISVCYARHASGKSSIKYPTDAILAPIRKRDKENEIREQQWRDECNTKGKNKDRPKRPDNLCQQILPPDLTSAAFTQRLLDAMGLPILFYMEELEQLLQLSGKSQPKHLGPIIRLAYDRAMWGQLRASTESVNGSAPLNLNMHANTTPEKAMNFFGTMLTDGTLDRITFTTIVGKEKPIYGDFGPEYENSILPYTELLSQVRGTHTCIEALEWAERMEQEQEVIAEEIGCTAYEGLYPRAIQNAFYRAMVLYLMEGNRWTPQIEAFATWSLEHDLWCKWNLFGQKLIEAQQREDALLMGAARMKSPTLELLPREFTREDVINAYEVQGKNSKAADTVLRQWKCRGKVRYDEDKKVYLKCS